MGHTSWGGWGKCTCEVYFSREKAQNKLSVEINNRNSVFGGCDLGECLDVSRELSVMVKRG